MDKYDLLDSDFNYSIILLFYSAFHSLPTSDLDVKLTIIFLMIQN